MMSCDTPDSFRQVLASTPNAIFVDFTASWCGPCRNIAPVFEALSAEYHWCRFIKVDVDRNQETASAYGVRAMPTFKVFQNGVEVGQMQGANPDGLRQLVETHAGSKPAPPRVSAEASERAQREALVRIAGDRAHAQTALETIRKVLQNVMADPDNPKFRTLKVANKTISEKILACPGARELLLAAGFEALHVGELARPELLQLPSHAEMTVVAKARLGVEALLSSLQNSASQEAPSTPAS